jgi:tetratricopeptide (TPR) repeat protein
VPNSSGGDREGTRSDLSGNARDVVQARDVSGGVHFHFPSGAPGDAPQELPRDTEYFLNRVHAVEDLDELLARPMALGSSAVFVIDGTAGVGKTSLAIHWAHRVRGSFPDGQLYINLRGYDPGTPATADEALERFLSSLGVPASHIPVRTDHKASLYRSLLAGRRLLVVLDNAATVAQVRPLLPGASRSVTVVTSRNRMAGLIVRDGARRSTMDVLSAADAMELLVTTTREFRLHDDPADVAELARLCAFLPLALRVAGERAASRSHTPLASLIQELRDESALWDALSADDEDEASAVRSVFAWSYRALPADVATLFCLLGLHPANEFSVHAVAALVGMPVDRVRHPIEVLVSAHLLDNYGFDRYQFHDLLRAYSANCLKDNVPIPEQQEAVDRVCRWYLHSAYSCVVASAHDSTLLFFLGAPPAGVTPLTFAGAADARRWYAEERLVLAAVVRAAKDTPDPELVWRLAAVLERLYASNQHLRDWRATSLMGLDAARSHNNLLGECLMYESLGRWSRMTMRLDEAEEYHRAGIEANLALGDRLGTAKGLNSLGWVHLFGHHLASALESFIRCLEISEELRDEYWIATAAYGAGYACLQLARPSDAGPYLLRSQAIFRALGDRLYEALLLSAFSMLERDLGLTEFAAASARDAVELSRESGNAVWEATTLLYLGKAQRALGAPGEALISYQRSAAVSRNEGDGSREAIALEGAGGSYQDLARPADAVAFHRRAATAHRQLGDRWKLAKSLSTLADALEAQDVLERQIGRHADDIDRYRQDAVTILGSYEDPKSTSRRADVRRKLELSQ